MEQANPFVNQDFESKQNDKIDRYKDRAEKARTESASRLNSALELGRAIPFGQPILIGHHSEARHRSDIKKIDNNMRKSIEADEKASHYETRADSVGSNGIASDDPTAIEQLEVKLKEATDFQELMKKANRLVKKQDIPGLISLGMSENAAQELLRPDFAGRLGFARYQLTNNNAKIKSIKDRIRSLKAMHEMEPLTFNSDDFNVITEEGRIQFVFTGKPNEIARSIIKKSAFKWSRYSSAWVRKATLNAIYSAKRLIEQLKGLESVY